MLKWSLLGQIFCSSGARGQKLLKFSILGLILVTSGTRTVNAKIQYPGATSGARAGKYST